MVNLRPLLYRQGEHYDSASLEKALVTSVATAITDTDNLKAVTFESVKTEVQKD